ncbi:tRNA methyltransferas-like protein [Amniculicola lignicola CBS 123094]|uniref:tRNA methyltransferas-like protein n=1 Tax=Amniculicola lignicola CBS 123094 TaxID=1392246 RepID=A0A6A5WF14_9PLEO|nr:tRNA methyltransferas-like protein [Amniculicola lignicola CBS 123094]
MTLPFQCIEAYSLPTERSCEWAVFGVCGSRLVVQTSSGVTSTWPTEQYPTRSTEPADEPEGPPGKRVKLSPPADQIMNFSCLTLSNGKEHIVAITAEDKCIRVFRLDSENQLQQLSQRCMARRPCALAITSDDSTILCADKFGDVYSLPLQYTPEDDMTETPIPEESETPAEKDYKPAASVLTVHSGRNRKVLEEQMKQASKGVKKSKEPLKFKHELLLGHVSMLTDIAYARIDERSYILTADRDEHIRVSRGPPQAHIIEGFCQGHDEFVTKLCLPTPGVLVSGGGDPHLYIWDWVNSRLLNKFCIRDAVSAFMKTLTEDKSNLEDKISKTVVSGIWNVPATSTQDVILVACEGVPAVFSISLGGTNGPPVLGQTIPLTGNALDVGIISQNKEFCTAIVSIDNIHKPGSTTEIREDEGPNRLQCFSCKGNEWHEDSDVMAKLEWLNRRALGDEGDSGTDSKVTSQSPRRADEKALRDILYGMENLRKRPGAED